MNKERDNENYDVVVKSEIYFIHKDKSLSSINKSKPKLVSCHRITREMMKNEQDKSELINNVILQQALDLKIQIRKREIESLIYGLE